VSSARAAPLFVVLPFVVHITGPLVVPPSVAFVFGLGHLREVPGHDASHLNSVPDLLLLGRYCVMCNSTSECWSQNASGAAVSITCSIICFIL